MIHVRYFASLRERMGRAVDRVPADARLRTVADVRAFIAGGRDFPDNALIAVNTECATLTHEVHEGDEIAFFPP